MTPADPPATAALEQCHRVEHRELCEALQFFVESFEMDFMFAGEIVDHPERLWAPILRIYHKQKQALEKAKASDGGA